MDLGGGVGPWVDATLVLVGERCIGERIGERCKAAVFSGVMGYPIEEKAGEGMNDGPVSFILATASSSAAMQLTLSLRLSDAKSSW